MANLDQTFDINELPQGTSNFDPLPPGWYSGVITGAELKNTKNGTGQYISIKYQVTAPIHQGRVVFGNINIKNANPKAEEIGRQQLGEIMRAIGVARLQDTDQLLGRNPQIKLGIRESEGYEPQNEFKGFKAIEGSAPPVAHAPAPASAPSKATPPWAKK